MMNARLEELRAKFQENPRRYFAPFANELRKAGDAAQAIAVCRTHLAGQPGHVSGHIVLGQALHEAGDKQEARDVFTAALDLDPENLIALRTLGEIAQINGEFGMARLWYERLLDADPRNAEVSQLLRDIPSETAARSTATPPAAAAPPEALTEALPDGATSEPPPPTSPSFHTSFTGSGPAYKSAEPDDEPIEEPVRAQSSDFEPAAQVESVESDLAIEQSVPAAAESATESLDLIDVDSFQLPTPAAKSLDSYDGPSVVKSHGAVDLDLELTETETAKADAEVPENAPADEADIDVLDEAPPTPTAETPRARFAEHGFEGPADDQIGWMTTPSAALSDLESAPENWFDEAEAEAEEPRSEETAAAEMTAPDQSSDSWFDEVEGATAIESTEVSSEEFWLTPELPRIPSAEVEEPAVHDHDFQDEAPVSATANDAAADDAMVMASAEHDGAPIEAESFDVAAMDEDLDDAVMGEPPAEVSAAFDETEPVEPEPVQAEQWTLPAEPEPAHAAQSTESEPEPAQAWQWTEPAEPEPAQAAQWEEPVESQLAEAVHAPDRDDPSANEPALAGNVIGHTPGFIDAVSPPPAPFVTETLAELYLQQGFRDEALVIYRQLVERAPENELLRQRVQAIEEGTLFGGGAQSPDVPIEERTGSQSVRTFFSRLARRPAVTGPSGSTPTPSGTSRTDPEIPFAAAASALASLFSASKPPASDEGAAATLAGAFTDPAGRPSRAADRELSLDHLFRDVPPGGSASAGVSLDEFYATPIAPPGSPTEPGEAAGTTEPGGTDIRQFTAWLEGLRKK